MEELSSVFIAVLGRCLESFAPVLNQAITKYENDVAMKTQNQDQFLLLMQIFDSFPRQAPAYKTMIKTLVTVASCNPEIIELYLAQVIEEIRTTSTSPIFSNVSGMSPMYKNDNPYHKQFLLNFMCFFTVDLLCNVIYKYGTKESVKVAVETGYKLCLENSILPWLHPNILKQYSVIFSLISNDCYEWIARSFSKWTDKCVTKDLFKLICYTKLNMTRGKESKFLHMVINCLEKTITEKKCTISILQSVAKLITTAIPCDLLNKLWTIAWSLRDDRKLKDGAFDLIATLFCKVKESEKEKDKFFKKRVYAHTSDPKKVDRSLMLLQRLMYGTDVKLSWLMWNWGIEDPEYTLCFIQWNSEPGVKQSSPDSFSSIFMKYFFGKSDFTVNPKRFTDILVHLASLDFNHFCKNIVPQFLALEYKEPRFTVLTSAASVINTSEFLECNYCKCTPEDIDEFNNLIKTKVISSLSVAKIETKVASVSFLDHDAEMKTKTDAADEKVDDALKDWKVDFLGPVLKDYNKSQDNPNPFSPDVQLVRCVAAILNPEDFMQPSMIKLCLKLAAHQDRRIASAGLSICRCVLDKPELQVKFVQAILKNALLPKSDEELFVYLTLLLGVVSSKPKNVKMSIFHDIECVAFIGFVSIHPSTRFLSYRLLQCIDGCLANNSSLSLIRQSTTVMESVVKKRILQRVFSESPTTPTPPAGTIKFETAILCHYFDIWLLFVSEMTNIIIAANYTPLLQRFRESLLPLVNEIKKGEAGPVPVGILILYLSTHFHLESLLKSPPVYNVAPYQPFAPSSDTREEAAVIIRDLLNSRTGWGDQLAFQIVEHIHFTLYPQILRVFGLVTREQLADAAHSIVIMLRSPAVTSTFLRSILQYVFSFLAVMQSHFVAAGVNGPRVFEWTPETEANVAKMSDIIRNYCCINTLCFINNSSQISEDEWSLPSREIVFRFLTNWSMTKSESLESVRAYAAQALLHIVRVGPIFNDALLFDQDALTLFADIESSGRSVLSFLLYFHVDLLLDIYIDAVYTLPRSSGDLFFDSIIIAFDAQNTEFIYKLTGPLLLLGLVYWQEQHPRAESFVRSLVAILTQKRSQETRDRINELMDQTSDFRSELPKFFAYATESVVSSALRVLKFENRTIPTKDIVDSIQPWVANMRLLPKQSQCLTGTPSEFHQFTPYQFLVALMETTEAVGADDFLSIAPLWHILLQTPDHYDLIPLFVGEWQNSTTKKKMFNYLLDGDSSNVVKRLAQRCNFAYYFHVTECLQKSFDDEMWIVQLIENALLNGSDELVDDIPVIVHFGFIFAETEAKILLNAIYDQFGISIPDGIMNMETIVSAVQELVGKFQQNAEQYLNIWATEALKWVFGCRSLKIATLSLTIYNLLGVSADQTSIMGICKSAAFHLEQPTIDEDEKLLTQFIGETFKFYTTNFADNETFAFNYGSAFLDCVLFVTTSLPLAAQLFIKSLSSQLTNTSAWNSIISIIRPLLVNLETDEHAQKIFDLLIRTSMAEELIMIIAPIKENRKDLFQSVDISDNLLDKVSSTSMCKALVHYAMMIDSASPALANSIFKNAASIVKRIVNENNRTPLSKLYKAALGSLNVCPRAIDFIVTIAKKEPSVATKSAYEFYDWARSLEDVVRGVKRLLPKETISTTITDCTSLEAVSSLLQCEAPPKIMPFAAQREMIDGMQRVQQKLTRRRGLSIRRFSQGGIFGPQSRGILPQVSILSNNLIGSPQMIPQFIISGSDFEPLKAPKKLLHSSAMKEKNSSAGFVMSAAEFLASV